MEILLGIMFIVGLVVLGYLLFFGKKEEDDVVFEEIRDPVILHIAVPRQNDKTPLAAEQMFASLHGIVRDNRRAIDFLSFEISLLIPWKAMTSPSGDRTAIALKMLSMGVPSLLFMVSGKFCTNPSRSTTARSFSRSSG